MSQLESKRALNKDFERLLTAAIMVKPREVPATVHLEPLQEGFVASVHQLVFHQHGRQVTGV